jgi:hypothetical protein
MTSVDSHLVDIFIDGPVDTRIHRLLPTELWQLLLSYLPVRDVIPKVPLTNKYLCHEVVWGKWSGPLLWGEMTGVDAKIFAWRDQTDNVHTVLMRACHRGAPSKHLSTLISGGMKLDHADKNNIFVNILCLIAYLPADTIERNALLAILRQQ